MKKTSSIILVVIIILLLGVIAAVGFLYLKNNGDSNKKINELEQQISEKKNNNLNNVVIENKAENNSVDNKKSVANEAIKKALKDKEWIKKNINKVSNYNGNIRNKFIKLKDIDNMPAYIIDSDFIDEHLPNHIVTIVTYKDGKVTILPNRLIVQNVSIEIDEKNNYIKEIDEAEGFISLYKIVDSEFYCFASTGYDQNGEIYIKLNDEDVDEKSLQPYVSGCRELTLELNDENIDKY